MALSDFRRKFAIVGLGVTKVGHLPQYTGITLQTEAARLAIEDAGLKREDIDGAINARIGGGTYAARQDWTDAFARRLGLPVNFYFSIERGGGCSAWSIISAAEFLELGIAKYVIVALGETSWSNTHGKRGERTRFEGTLRSGLWGVPMGDIPAVGHHSFFATRHMYEYGTTSRQFGAIAVAERQWACLNPAAYMHGRPITIEDYEKSPIVAWPYHVLDCSLQSDGGTAFILTTAERAKDCKRPPIYVMGVGFGEHIRKLWWEKGHHTRLDVEPAKKAAFGQAGIELKDIDVAQLYDCFTGEVLLQLEDYGWCGKGEGGPFVEAGNTAPGGTIPVNTGGGLLSSHHFADLTGFAEAVTQLRGQAGTRQVKNCEIAMVTGHGGEITRPGMCSMHSCLVLAK